MATDRLIERGSPKLTSISHVEKPAFDSKDKLPHLRFNFDGGPQQDIPLLSVRDSSHHEHIAAVASSGKKVIFVAGGVVGALIAVERTDNQDPKAYEFWDIKPGRPDFAKVPMLLKHESQAEVIDWNQVHPGLRFLQNLEDRKKLSGPYPLHVIWPFDSRDRLTDRTVFVTTPQDTLNLPEDMQVNVDTVCLFFHRDADWLRVAQLGSVVNERARWGVTSCNPHKRKPPFSLEEFKADLIQRSAQGEQIWESNAAAIIDDPISNIADVGSSHTQVRVQHQGEANLSGDMDTPTLFVVRRGSLSTEGLKAHIARQFPDRRIDVQVLPSSKLASRKHSDDMVLDDRLNLQAELARPQKIKV